MTKILRYDQFDEELYIFDFDDTLAKTPKFEEIALQYIKESDVKSLLDDSVRRISADLSDLEYENGRLFINDPDSNYEAIGNWVRKKTRLYLTTPNLFSYIDQSMPTELKEISELYKSVENKCILTARPEGSRKKIEDTLKKLGLEYPKYGIYMRPDKLNNAGAWKGNKIIEIAKKYNFTKVNFYDDDPRYLKRAKKVIDENMPELDINMIKIK